MTSTIARHWGGRLNAWLSLLVTLVIYLVTTVGVIGIGIAVGDSALIFGVLSCLWIGLNLAAMIGTFRSALRALGNGRTRPVEAVGGGVAIAVLTAAAYFAMHDLWSLFA